MPRNPEDEAIAATYPADFQRVADALGMGWGVDSIGDADYHAVASEVVRQNLPDLYVRAQALDGGFDANANPAFTARLAQTGATTREVRAFAEGLYPDLTPAQAIARYNRDVLRASGAKDVKEPDESRFDRPY